MANGLSDVDVELFGSLFPLIQQLTVRVDERLEKFGLHEPAVVAARCDQTSFPEYAPIGLPYALGHLHAISSAGGT